MRNKAVVIGLKVDYFVKGFVWPLYIILVHVYVTTGVLVTGIYMPKGHKEKFAYNLIK